MMTNDMTVTLKMKRRDVCALLLACTMVGMSTESKKWSELHDRLEKMLNDFDEKNIK